MTVFGVSLLDLLLLTFCFSVPFAVLALIVTVLYRRDRRLTPPEAANIAGDIHPRYPRSAPQPRPARTTPETADGDGAGGDDNDDSQRQAT